MEDTMVCDFLANWRSQGFEVRGSSGGRAGQGRTPNLFDVVVTFAPNALQGYLW